MFRMISLLHNTSYLDALGQRHAEGVDARGEPSEVDCGLVLEGGDAPSGVVVDVHAQHLFVRGVAGLGAVLVHVGGGADLAQSEVVDVVEAVVSCVSRCQDVAEGDVPTCSGVGGEIDRDGCRDSGAGVVDGDDRSERVGTVEAFQHTHLQLVLQCGLTSPSNSGMA